MIYLNVFNHILYKWHMCFFSLSCITGNKTVKQSNMFDYLKLQKMTMLINYRPVLLQTSFCMESQQGQTHDERGSDTNVSADSCLRGRVNKTYCVLNKSGDLHSAAQLTQTGWNNEHNRNEHQQTYCFRCIENIWCDQKVDLRASQERGTGKYNG